MKTILAMWVLSLVAYSAAGQPDDRPAPRPDGPPPAATDRPDDPPPPPPPPHERGPDAPHDRMGEHPGRYPGGRGALSPEEVEVALDTLARIDPEIAADLRQRYDENPQQVGRALVERFPRIRMFLKLREFDPDMFELRIEDIRLARQTAAARGQYRRARRDDNAPAMDEHAAHLRELLAERFEVRQRIREREIEGLEDRLLILREQLEEQADRKEAEIDGQLDHLTAEREERERMDRQEAPVTR